FCVTRRSAMLGDAPTRRPSDAATPEARTALAELEEAGVDFIYLGRTSKLDPRPWRRLIGELRQRRIDVLHTHMFGSNLWGAALGPVGGVPVFVAHEHTWSFEGEPLRQFLERELIARRAAAFVAVSQADRRRMTEVEGIPPSKTRFIPNGIPTPQRSASGRDIRAELGIGPEQPVVGAVGTLRPQKAYDVMIRSALVLRREFPDVRFLIVGGEEHAGTAEQPRLEQLVRELGLEETVTLVGFSPEPFDLICSFDVAALSSDFEGSPLSLLECMEAAKPVVATRVGGVPDIVRDGETGFLVEARDPDGMAEAIARLFRDPTRAEAMGRAGREVRNREFSFEGMMTRVEDLYEELYAAKFPGSPS
ncbi:MAG: glycosyltransferase, partial [Actinomycetota bacterium]|nr:glycosyltransferase [Actinomycetota bacterium]